MTKIVIGNPSKMVDVSEKDIAKRIAVAEMKVHFPANLFHQLQKNGFRIHKGSIKQIAVIVTFCIYDLCKSLSHDINICPTQLISKMGGTNNFKAIKNKKRHF